MQPKKFSEYTPITETNGDEVVPILKNGDNATVETKNLPISTATQAALDSKISKIDFAANVKDYGAIGDGLTNDTLSIQQAIDENDSIYFPDGDYLVDLISINGATKHLFSYGNARLLQNSINGVIEYIGGWDFIEQISSIAGASVETQENGEATNTSFVTQATMASNHILNRGDVVKIVSDDLFTGVLTTDNRRGEYGVIAIDSSTSIATLSHVLEDTYTTNPRIGKLKDVRLILEGITFDVSPDLGALMDNVFSYQLSLRASNGAIIRQCKFNKAYGAAIGNFGHDTTIKECNFRNLENRPSVSHYGYGIQDGGSGTKVISCDGRNLRHLYSQGGYSVGANSGNLEYFGGGSSQVISNSVCYAPQSAGFDTHEMARHVLFDNCIVYGSYQGANSGGNAFTARGADITFNGCLAVACKTGYNISTTGGAALNNCRATLIANEPINVLGLSSFGSVTTMPNIRINGGYFEGGQNTGGTYSSLGSLGSTGFDSSIEMRNVTFVLKGNISGTRAFDIRQCNLKMYDCKIDFSQFTGAVSWTAFSVRDSLCNIVLSRISVDGGSSPITAFSFLNGFSAGCTSPVEINDLYYAHSIRNATVVGTNMTSAYRMSWVQLVGSTRTSSSSVLYTPTASGTLPIGNINDKVVNIVLTGANGNITLTTVPVGVEGQTVNIANISNGTVGCTGGLPDFLIPPQGSFSMLFMGSFWRPIQGSHKLFTAPTTKTLTNGANNNVSPVGTIVKSMARIIGPTAPFSVTGWSSPADGMMLILWNTTAQQMTIANESASSTAANRFTTPTGADINCKTVTCTYDAATSRWVVVSYA